MIGIRNTKAFRALLAGCLVAAGTGGTLKADDTEIYQASYDNADVGGRPKVLIVFDNSGSMFNNTVPGSRPAYDPSIDYGEDHEDGLEDVFDSKYIYWTLDEAGAPSEPPPQGDEDHVFEREENRCAESYEALNGIDVNDAVGPFGVGYFQTKARRWQTKSGDSQWIGLAVGNDNTIHVDCLADLNAPNPENGPDGDGDGYPVDPPDPSNPPKNFDPYGATIPGDSNITWGDRAYTFYSSNYLNWYYNTELPIVNPTRMEIAKEVVTGLVQANTGVDFGLALFNYNFPEEAGYDGGRIVRRIINGMDKDERTALVDIVNGINTGTSTPLCEATYEAYRYISGQSLEWADNKRDADKPDRDLLAEEDGLYIRPSTDCTYTYIILMTDGYPQYDTYSNQAIKDLTGQDCANYENFSGAKKENCLPQLTEYMANTDLDGDDTNGNQYGITYTIGFAVPAPADEEDRTLLEDAANLGKGEYFEAKNAAQLTAAFQKALLGILATDASFSSPAVAIDSFTRTQSRDEVFFSMFKPSDTVEWPGNIKKLSIDVVDEVTILVDSVGSSAISPVSGAIAETARTYWSTYDDGGDVTKGGVGELMLGGNRNNLGDVKAALKRRTIYTNSEDDVPAGELVEYKEQNLEAKDFGFDDNDTAALFLEFGVDAEEERKAAVDYGRGFKWNIDNPTQDPRSWVLGDMLHSQPAVVNYGYPGGRNTTLAPDLSLVVGTNAGFLHMFGNDDGEEDWAFFPKELAAVLTKRANNEVSTNQVYGIDASPVIYAKDKGLDGTLDFADGDVVRVYFGLRRGGRDMYGLDISNPEEPGFLWHIDEKTTGFSQLGQTWSAPRVTAIPGYKDGSGKPKPVVIFGAGYDPNKDDKTVGTPDTYGRGLFIVDAVDGSLVWSVTPDADTATNLQEITLLHSVPGNLTILDSNGDELTDRIYFGDTGGNVWRVDLSGTTLPAASQDTWSITRLADFNDGSEANDRRFFNAPDIVRTKYLDETFDAVLIGTGDRTNPKAEDVENHFYMIRDSRTLPYTAPHDPADCDEDPVTDFRCELPVTLDKLYDVTPNTIQTAEGEALTEALDELATKKGWYLKLLAGAGEKNLSSSLTIEGVVYFGTFAPESLAVGQCTPEPGTGRLYAVSLFTATAEVDFGDDGSGSDPGADRAWVIGSLIPDTPAPYFGEDGEIRLLLPPGTVTGDGEGAGNPFGTGSQLPKPFGTYWYREEQ